MVLALQAGSSALVVRSQLWIAAVVSPKSSIFRTRMTLPGAEVCTRGSRRLVGAS